MNDASYLIILLFFGIVFVLINIWRASTKRRLSDKEKQRIKLKQRALEKKSDVDLTTDPEFSFLKFNIFHKDRNDNDN
jgi:hypothetical protein